MKQVTKLIIALIFLHPVFIFSQEVNKNNWPGESVYIKGTLGEELLRIFKPHCETCGIDNIGKKFKKIEESKRNYIPNNLVNKISIKDFSLEHKDFTYVSITSSGLMLNAFNKTEIEDKNLDINSLIANNRKLDVTYSAMPKNFLATQGNRPGFLLRANCAAYLESAAKAKIGIPVAKFEAAMDANAKSESSVALIYGWVTSPLFEYISSTENQNQAYQDLWKFYHKNSDFVDDAYFVQEFLGLQVKHLQGNDQNIDFDAKLNAKGGTGIYSGQITAATGLKQSNTYTQLNWETYIIQNKNKTNLRWDKLPEVNTVKEKIEHGVSTNIKGQKKFNIATKGEFSHFAILIGLEKDFCQNQNSFEVNLKSKGVYKDDAVILQSTTYSEKDKTCACKLIGVLNNDEFSQANISNPLKIEYTLTHKDKIKKSEDEVISLDFNFVAQFTKSDHPTAIVKTEYNYGTKPSNLGSDFVDIVWEIPIRFNDRNKPVNFDLGNRAEYTNSDNPSFSGLGEDENISIVSFRADRLEPNEEVYMLKLKLEKPLQKSSSSGTKKIASRLNFNVPLAGENAGLTNLTVDFNLIMPEKKIDTDGDGHFDEDDNCPNDSNREQRDSDKDNVGDICDNCPQKANPDQKDTDQDGTGDACEEVKEPQKKEIKQVDVKSKKSKKSTKDSKN